MEILQKTEEGTSLKIVVNSNEETLFSLLKVYLEKLSDVDVVGLYREHHLIDRTEFFLKVKKGSAMDCFKKALKTVKKDLEQKKVK
jgi:DNA-directed RNA polymerase subunit L